MLTGDENIVDINFVLLWMIKDAGQYLFNIRDPEATVKAVAESAMREIVGKTPIAEATTEARGRIEQGARELTQAILDAYGAGVLITQVQLQKVDPPGEVIEAFRDVQRAQADRERAQNEAETFANDILPRARGEAERISQEAQAYRQEVVARAQGDAQRFLAVYNEFDKARDVTVKRHLSRDHGGRAAGHEQGADRSVRRGERRRALPAAARARTSGPRARPGRGHEQRWRAAAMNRNLLVAAGVAGGDRPGAWR